METDYTGIDYGNGKTNVSNTGIRFGVLPFHEILQVWCDESEEEYGEPHCPYCGNDNVFDCMNFDDDEDEYTYNGTAWEYACKDCKRIFSAGDSMSEPTCHFYMQDGYKALQSNDNCDIFVEKSPFYTYAQFCSPCAPGACYLLSPLDDETKNANNRCYCFGHDWFENGQAPYPVYSVSTNELIKPEEDTNK